MKPFSQLGLVSFAVMAVLTLTAFRPIEKRQPKTRLFEADDKRFQYTGRIDFSNPKLPKFWAPGVYIKAKFIGPSCDLLINDEILWGKSHNYLEIAIDENEPFRIQTSGPKNVFHIAERLNAGAHTVTICKDTEAGIGSLEFVGLQCEGLASPSARPSRKLEFIGDSITCGTGSDLSKIACDKGEWYDQHNAYLSYGPTAARSLNSQWVLSSVSGIGMMHSCCDMKVVMTDVWDQLDLQTHDKRWDFKRYQPDAVMICLGQNDGVQDQKSYVDNYAKFVQKVRKAYPKTHIFCLTSPMADSLLVGKMKENLNLLVSKMEDAGEKRVHSFFFSRSFNGGCGGHPDLTDHKEIASELSAALKSTLHW